MKDGDEFTFDLEHRIPSTAADVEAVTVSATNATGAMRRGITRKDFKHPISEVDLPIVEQPLHVCLSELRKSYLECRRGGERSIDFINPARFGIGKRIITWNVGFDIEDGRAFDEVARSED